MKNLLFTLLILAGACNKESSPNTESPLNLIANHEERVYEFGEPIEFTLQVETKGTVEEHFLLTATPLSDPAFTFSINGEATELGTEQLFDYQIINESGSTALLHISITPTKNIVSAQTCGVEFRVFSESKEHSAIKSIQFHVSNTSEITTAGQYPQAPQNIEVPVNIVLYAEKQNFAGEFHVTPTILEGEGYFQIADTNYGNGEPFHIVAGDYVTLSYQALTLGQHKITFTFSDNLKSAELTVNLSMRSQHGTSNPANGIYIYYQGVYYTKEQWPTSTQIQAEGVAVVADRGRFLIGRRSYYGTWGSIPEESKPLLDLVQVDNRDEVKNDFSGSKNTLALYPVIKNSGSSTPLVISCHNHDPQQPGRWYLPTGGQLHMVSESFSQINELCQTIEATTFYKLTNFTYNSTSTIGPEYRPWSLKILDGDYTYYPGEQYAFPVCDLQ